MNIQNKLFILTLSLAGALLISGCGKKEEGPKPEGAKPEAKTTVGTEIDDSTITTKVKSALLAASDVKGSDIKVETNKGVVQLSGFVETQAQADRGAAIAKGVEGVKSVENKLSVKATTETVGEKVDDAVITTKVKAALLADPVVKSGDIGVVTRDGEVQLSGFVDTQDQIDRASEVVRSVQGVKNVRNELSIKK